MSTKTVSPKQVKLITSLIDEREFDLDTMPFCYLRDVESLTGGRDGTASAVITGLFAAPRKGKSALNGTTAFVPAEGLYQSGDVIVRVRTSKRGNWYAERAERPAEGSGRTRLDWEYLGRRIDLSGAQPLDDATAGRILVFCVRCGAPLTDPESVERGMGPICSSRGM